MSKVLTVRNLDPAVYERFVAAAARHHRSAEAHARFLIERETAGPLETCGELVDHIWSEPAPEVEIESIESYLNERGRRSPRP